MSLPGYLPNRSSDPLKFQGYDDQRAEYIQRYIFPIQLQRFRQDVQSWRDSLNEAEAVFYPWRVKIQQIYNDVVLDAHVDACMRRRKNLTLLKDFGLFSGEKENEEASKVLRSMWFYEMMNHILDAPAFGYTLVSFGDMLDFTFPDLFAPKRANISPDRKVLASWPYSPTGIHFLDPAEKDDNGQSFSDWTLYIATPSDVGNSLCGYGYLYKVAMYQIMSRNNLGWNADFVETYGQPYRIGKTDKLDGPEADAMEAALRNMGSSAYGMISRNDDVEFVEAKAAGTGWKSYDNLENRCEKKISKVILGHADAMDSTPGKLGANQGGAESPQQKALDEIQMIDNKFVEHVVNTFLIPKLLKLGIPVPTGHEFRFKNDHETQEQRENEDKNNTSTAQYVYNLKQAGWDVDQSWLEERLGCTLEKPEPIAPPALPGKPGEEKPNTDEGKPTDKKARAEKIRAKLKALYGGKEDHTGHAH